MRQSSKFEGTLSPSLDSLVADVTEQLSGAVERASQELGNELIAEVLACAFGEPRTGKERRAQRRAEREQERFIARLTKQLLAGIEQATRVRARELTAERRRAEAGGSESGAARGGAAGVGAKPRRRRKPVRPAPPPLDPEQIKRDAEFARLRALLKPVADEPAAQPPAPPAAPAYEPPRPSTPGGALRALEKEIQDTVPTLGRLGPERCAAQIAVWAGQVRDLRDRLPPDVAATMRPAFRIFLEHLGQLQGAMEAQVVDALEPTFNAPDWDIYIEANRARVEQRPPRLSDDQLHVFHRTMLRALILPHRRNANQEAIAILEAASRALPPTDPQLQSALRRFASLWKTRAEPAAPKPEAAEPAASEPAANPPVPAETSTEPAATPDSEFDSPWVK